MNGARAAGAPAVGKSIVPRRGAWADAGPAARQASTAPTRPKISGFMPPRYRFAGRCRRLTLEPESQEPESQDRKADDDTRPDLATGPPRLIHRRARRTRAAGDEARAGSHQGPRVRRDSARRALAIRATTANPARQRPGHLVHAAARLLRHRDARGPALRTPSRRRTRHRPAALQAAHPRDGRATHGV